ncbi:MAG TPA: ComEC/Rec2 family competence protein [Actinomycetes bacterium]|nr:ComEC/Rec2 family competence protein [Actinomycetes bacterium]
MAPLADPRVTWVVVLLVLLLSAFIRRALPRWVLLALILGAVSAASMAFRIAQLDADPIATWAEDHRHVVASGTLTEDPSFETQPGFSGLSERVVVEVRVEHMTSGTQSVRVRAPLLVIGSAQGWHDLRVGDTVEVEGALRPRERTEPVAAILFTSDEVRSISEPPGVLRAAETMRSGLRDAVSGLPADVRGLLPALVAGDTSEMSSLLESDLQEAGLTHLTAVSGANVAIVVGAVLLLARWAGVRSYALVAIGVLSVGWFVLLARPQPSVLRAAVMGSLALVAVCAAGQTQAARTLFAAVFVLLLADPWLARSWGFALSVAATAGLVLLARRWSARLPRSWPRPLRDALAVALAAQVVTLPLVVALSGHVPMLSVVANVLATPAVGVATVLGATSAAIAPISPTAAAVTAWLAQWPTSWIVTVAESVASSPVATLPWPSGWFGGVTGALMVLGCAALIRFGARRRWWRPRRVIVIAVMAAAIIVAVQFGPGRWPPAGWVIVACDVGQGDALAVNLGDDAAMVVDAGPDPALVDRCLDRLGITRVPLLVLTHFHADHVAGVSGVLDGRAIGTVLVSPLREPDDQVAATSRWTRGLRVVDASVGQSGGWKAATWRVLWPPPTYQPSQDEGSGPNNASVAMLVEVSGIRLLLTGDVEPEAQAALTKTGVPSADVLKVPHHGSKYQDEDFLSQVDASVALVSVGEGNTYGHPDPGLVDALSASGMVVARTDQQGTVAVVAEDGGLRVVSMP